MVTTRSITAEADWKKAASGRPASPAVMVPTPSRMATKIMASMSPLASASTIFSGTMPISCSATVLLAPSAFGTAPPMLAPTPGCSSEATAMPIATAMTVVHRNSAMVRPPSEPRRFGSPSEVTPAVIVTNTIGATSILIRRTNTSPRKATCGAAAGQASPTSTPSARPAITRFHSGIANQPQECCAGRAGRGRRCLAWRSSQ